MSDTPRNSGLIRMVLMGTAFIGLTVVLVVFQPGSPRHAALPPAPESSVTRDAPAPLEAVIVSGTAGATAMTQQPASVRDLTYGAISNLKSATSGATPAPGQPGSLLHGVVQRSLHTDPQSTQPMATNAAASGTYIVQPGDTLVGIAKKLYGDVNMASEIFIRNTGIMPRPDSLRAGMSLDLPPR